MTNLSIKVITGLLVLILLGCSTGSKKEIDITFEKTYALKHKVYDTELLISFGSLAVIDSFLIILSTQSESFCKVYSIPNRMKEVYSYGCIGNGPNEFLQPRLTYSYNNTFGIDEINTQELAIMCLENQDDNILITEKTRLKAPYKPIKGELIPGDMYFIRLDNSHYASLHHGGKSRFFSLLDSTLTPISRFGESPIPEELSVISSMNRLNGKIVACDGTMVFATLNLPYLSFYQLKSGKMNKLWSFFYDETFYQVKNDDLLFSKEKTFGQMRDLAMDSQYIYVLYLDQLLSEYVSKDPEKSFANKILVFDHKGNPVTELLLGCRIIQMALSSDKTKIYGLAHLPEPQIVEFDMPKELINKK